MARKTVTLSKLIEKQVPQTELESVTYGLGNRRSIQLSYWGNCCFIYTYVVLFSVSVFENELLMLLYRVPVLGLIKKKTLELYP